MTDPIPKPNSRTTAKRVAACFSNARLRDFVEERLEAPIEAKVLAHIDGCEQCQAALEEITGNRTEWSELQRQFDDALPEGWPAESMCSASNGEEHEPDGDRDMRALQQYFGPTDDPTKLGRLGHYEVIGFIGKGSTGVVLKAHEPQLNRFVAIKVLSPSFSSNGPARARFQREARAIAAVSHQHVVPVFAVDEYDGLPYIVMQYAGGGSLEQRISRSGPLSPCETIRVGIQIARGLAEAHSQGIVHRDVKPANVMLEGGVERVMVTDFGLARVADEAAMTRSGVVAGTPQYMSPEQARGEPVDPRSDLFSLGSVLYTACTGRSPFRAGSVFGVIKRVCDDSPRPIRETAPEVEPWLESFVGKLLEKNADDRFGSATEVADLLSAELAHAQSPTILPVPERPWLPAEPSASHAGDSNSGRRWKFALAGALAGALAIAGYFANAADGGNTGDRTRSTAGFAGFGSALALVAQDSEPQEGEAKGKAPAPPIFEIKSEQSFDLKKGGSVTVAATFETVRILEAKKGKARATVWRSVVASSAESAKELSRLHSFFVDEDGEAELKLRGAMGEEVAEGSVENPIQAAALDVWIPRGCSVKVTSTSGNVTFDEVGAKDLDGTTGSGDVNARLSGSTLPACRLTSASGAVDLFIPESAAQTIKAQTVTGKIQGPDSDVVVTGTWQRSVDGSPPTISLSSASGMIRTSYRSGDASAPLAGDEAEVPRRPEVAETPEVSEVLEAAEMPEAADVPEATEAPEASGTPEVAETPENPEASECGSDADCDESCDESSECGEACDGSNVCEEGSYAGSDSAYKPLSAAAPGRFAVQSGEFPGGIIDGYALYLPQSYDSNENNYPVIVSLASGCYVGGEIECLTHSGLPGEIKNALKKGARDDSEYHRLLLDSFIVVSPHMNGGSFEERQYFREGAAIGQLLDEVAESYRTDASRVYVTGAGRGGHGAWGLAARMPERFAAAVPIRGQNIGIEDYAALASMPIWAGHLTDDDEVEFEHSRVAVERIEAEAGEAFVTVATLKPKDDAYLGEPRLLTSYGGCGIPNLYAHPHVFKWLLGHSRTPAPTEEAAPEPEVAGTGMEGDERFR